LIFIILKKEIMKIQYQEQSLKILSQLSKKGLSAEIQQRIGAFHIIWGLFETNIEPTLWALNEETVINKYPSTDKTILSKQIDFLKNGSRKFTDKANHILNLTSCAAKDLKEYRHALTHGWFIPLPMGPAFIRNPKWFKELRKRKHVTNEAHIDENLLDMAIDTAWTLYSVTIIAKEVCKDISKISKLTTMKTQILRAESQANELCHLTELMNHEKY
jgi:2,4-dienoyl-CoA reductase-like NADH-dependent reductase (Old Yellow Enzyme family)